MYDRNIVINLAEEEEGYLEKRDGRNLYDKTANAGDKNYTKYGKEMHELYPEVMDYPAAWCDSFVDWLFMKAYGVCNARKLLGDFNDYTVASANLYKEKNAWKPAGTVPEPGWQIFFKNDKRICHTGLVIECIGTTVVTIEGNTSSAAGVVANGGCVRRKSYSIDYDHIAGYGVPAYEDGNFSFTPHWVHSENAWYYRVEEGKNAHGWKVVNHHRYYFAKDGKMQTGWQQVNGKWYYLEESGEFEGALWHESSERDGSLERWGV